jgi:hypothetical protein
VRRFGLINRLMSAIVSITPPREVVRRVRRMRRSFSKVMSKRIFLQEVIESKIDDCQLNKKKRVMEGMRMSSFILEKV